MLSKLIVKINIKCEKVEEVMFCALGLLILRNLEIKVGIKYSFKLNRHYIKIEVFLIR
jgi:hypothetical protein